MPTAGQYATTCEKPAARLIRATLPRTQPSSGQRKRTDLPISAVPDTSSAGAALAASRHPVGRVSGAATRGAAGLGIAASALGGPRPGGGVARSAASWRDGVVLRHQVAAVIQLLLQPPRVRRQGVAPHQALGHAAEQAAVEQ